ncbi:MAG: lipopolysaccharide biosynthesis protein [Steroidobacteraceae bacterium]
MSARSLRDSALSGVRWTVAARFGLQLITWPVTILVMRLLEPRDYGLLALATIVIGFIALFSELGLGAGLVQAHTVDDARARTASGVIIALNLMIAVLLVVAAPFIAAWFNEPALTPVMRVLTLELVISSFAAVPSALLERQLRFRELSLALIIGNVSGSAVTVIAALSGLGVWSLVLGAMTIAVTRTLALLFYHGGIVWPPLSLDLTPVRELARFSGHVIGARVLWYWYSQSDQVIVGRMLHGAQLGNYNVASQLAALPVGKVMDTVNRVSFPVLSRLREDVDTLRVTCQRLLGLFAVYSIGVCWGLASVAADFVHVVLGPQWYKAVPVLAILALVAPLRTISSLHNTMTTAVGSPQAATKELALASFITPLAILAGATWNGLNGAAIAWLGVSPVLYVLSAWLTANALQLRLRDCVKPLATPMLCGAIMYAVVWVTGVGLAARVPAAGLLVIKILAGAAAYLLAMRLVGPRVLRDGLALGRELMRPGATA